MPSPHSSEETQADARAIAGNLGAELVEIPIERAMEAYDERSLADGRRFTGRVSRGRASRPRTSRRGSAAT